MRLTGKGAGWLLAVAAFLLTPSPAFAWSADWGGMLCRLAEQNSGWGAFVSWVAYITGTFFVARALLLLRMSTEEPGRNPMSRVMLHGFTGAALLVFPSFAQMLINSVYGTAASGPTSGLVCTAAAPTTTGTIGLDVLAANFVNNIGQPAFLLGGYFCYIIGAFFIYRGLVKMAKYNTDPKAFSVNAIGANFFVGVLLMCLGRTRDLWRMTVFGVTPGATFVTPGGINWTALGVTGNTSGFDNAFMAAIVFIQLVGFIAFIRGWLLAKSVVEGVGNHTMGQALTHIIGGTLCMNIILFLQAADATLGVDFML